MKILAEYLSQQTSPLIDVTAKTYVDVPEFIKDEQFLVNLESYLSDNYGLHKLLPVYSQNDNAVNLIPIILTNLYATNAYMLNGLWQSTQQEYNPIENYRMTEEGKDTNSGEDTTTDDIGNTKTTETIGTRTDESQNAQSQTTNEHTVSPENTANYLPESKDVVTVIPKTDKFVAGQQTNIYEGDKKRDVHTLAHGHVLEHELTRSGNIGVTTSQQMLESEREIVNFNIYKVISDLIVSKLCSRVHVWQDRGYTTCL